MESLCQRKYRSRLEQTQTLSPSKQATLPNRQMVQLPCNSAKPLFSLPPSRPPTQNLARISFPSRSIIGRKQPRPASFPVATSKEKAVQQKRRFLQAALLTGR